MRECSEVRKGVEYGCQTCGRTESMLGNGTKLQACVACRKIGRKIVYCTRQVMCFRYYIHLTVSARECQIKDWKEGLPRPHKSICGKPLLENQLSDPPTSPQQDGSLLPRADPNFKRSPALLKQVSLLDENPKVDYVVSTSYNFISAT